MADLPNEETFTWTWWWITTQESESEEKKKKMPRGKVIKKRIGHMIMVKTRRVDGFVRTSVAI